MKKFTAGLLLSLLAPLAFANPPATAASEAYTRWMVGLDLSMLQDDAELLDKNFYALSATLGYRYRVMDQGYLIPELRFGYAVGPDNVEADKDPETPGRIVFDDMVSFALRAQYEHDEKYYGFVAPSYAYFGYMFSLIREDFERPDLGDSRGMGLGFGGGYRFDVHTSVELSMDFYDNRSLFSIGTRMNF